MSAPRAKPPRFRETYETRMIAELAARLVQLEESFRDHLLDCEGTREAQLRKAPQDLAFRRGRCEICAVDPETPHSTGPDCDTARRDMARKRM